MHEQIERQMLLNSYYALQTILESRGISYDLPEGFEVISMPLAELRAIVRNMRELARTPGG